MAETSLLSTCNSVVFNPWLLRPPWGALLPALKKRDPLEDYTWKACSGQLLDWYTHCCANRTVQCLVTGLVYLNGILPNGVYLCAMEEELLSTAVCKLLELLSQNHSASSSKAGYVYNLSLSFSHRCTSKHGQKCMWIKL